MKKMYFLVTRTKRYLFSILIFSKNLIPNAIFMQNLSNPFYQSLICWNLKSKYIRVTINGKALEVSLLALKFQVDHIFSVFDNIWKETHHHCKNVRLGLGVCKGMKEINYKGTKKNRISIRNWKRK